MDLIEPTPVKTSDSDVEPAPGDLLEGLGDHRVAVDGTLAALAREVDGGGSTAHQPTGSLSR
jgi:hypothetical protein